MLLPPAIGNPKDLNTSYTDFEHLLQDLSENRFSGYLRLNFWGYEGILVLDMGHMVQATSSEREVHLLGEQAILRILNKAREKDGIIEVNSLSNEVAIALGFALQALPTPNRTEYQNLSLSEVFQILEKDGMTGYVDLQFAGQRGIGTVFYLDGTPVEAVIRASSGKVASGLQVVEKFFEIAEFIRPHVQIFRATNPHSIHEEKAFIIPWAHQKYVQFWEKLLEYFNELFRERLKKDRFWQLFLKAIQDLVEDFSFLHPEKGQVHFQERHMKITGLVHHPTFLQAMVLAFRQVLRNFPARRIKKVDLNSLIDDIYQLTKQFEIPVYQFDPESFIFQVFEKVVE